MMPLLAPSAACAEPPPPPPPSDTPGGLPQWALDAITSPLVYVTVGIAVGVRVVGASDSVSTVVALSAFPVVGLSILARTPIGTALQAAATAKAEASRAGVAARDAARAAARAASPHYGARRPLLPLLSASPPPAHLDGALCGDYAFDPLGLAADGRMAKMFELELLHARWAMLAAPGALVPELLSRSGVNLGESVWWKVGAAKLAGDTINWGGIDGFHIAGGQGIAVIAACQLVLMGGPEYARYVGIKSLEPVGIYLPGDVVYPGGVPFDPLGLSDDAVAFEDQRVREVKNGRLAMLAWLGFFVQAAVTQEGPVANLMSAFGLE